MSAVDAPARPAQGARDPLFRAAHLSEIDDGACKVAHVNGHTLALFNHQGRIYAVDNRCPHMGFPLDKGTVNDCILTCHWHHARFDLASGGTFDPWADDLHVFPVELREGEIWVDLTPHADVVQQQRSRLRDGLERNLSLVIAKSVIRLLDRDEDPASPFGIGVDFGVRFRNGGWGQGLTMLTCLQNILPDLESDERPRALFHGLSATAADTSGMAPHFLLRSLPSLDADFATLKRWFRQFVEVRDSDGAERCIVSAVRSGVNDRQMAEMLFTAVTDHRYIQIGHVADFTNKAFEALDIIGWNHAEPVLASLAMGYAGASRMEESNTWRHPVDIVALEDAAFEQLPAAIEDGASKGARWNDRAALVSLMLEGEAAPIVQALLNALREGASPAELAQAVSLAAAYRIARFHTSNEFGDWDTALHTFTFANAMQNAVRRAPAIELLRGVFDAAMSVHLDRFLNIPPAALPAPDDRATDPDRELKNLLTLLNQQQQVNEAGSLIARCLNGGANAARVRATLGQALVREDRNFHTIQAVEAAFRQHSLLTSSKSGDAAIPLIAAARYLAAHAPTVRSQDQTYQVARRLHRGEHLYEL